MVYKITGLENGEILQSIDNIDISLNAFHEKLFQGDEINENQMRINDSPIRTQKKIPGILLLVGKTYGRSKEFNKGKPLYKCIPHNKNLPAFLIPYENKNVQFNKNISNKYILFSFANWDNKHPIGTIQETIGDVKLTDNFYEYQLHCKNLYIPIKDLTQHINRFQKSNPKYDLIENANSLYKLEDRRNFNIISVDPENCRDIDDAIGLNNNVLSIYISNVPIIVNVLNLWNKLSKRTSTIYLPDRKIPLLPNSISENMASLLENETRIAFTMDVRFKQNDACELLIDDIRFCNCLIRVRKNYSYDDPSLLEDQLYVNINDLVSKLLKNYKFIEKNHDSHDVISFLMILMNYECSKKLSSFDDGIYRSFQIFNQRQNLDDVPPEIYKLIRIWTSSSSCKYTKFEEKNGHELIGEGLDSYIHITSPIRRIVDLINMSIIQKCLNLLEFNDDALSFINRWKLEIDYINESSKAIKNIQIDCNLLNTCSDNSGLLNEKHMAYVFNRTDIDNNRFEYTVYIPKIKHMARCKLLENLPEYSCLYFKIFLIEDGLTLKRKIRLMKI